MFVLARHTGKPIDRSRSPPFSPARPPARPPAKLSPRLLPACTAGSDATPRLRSPRLLPPARFAIRIPSLFFPVAAGGDTRTQKSQRTAAFLDWSTGLAKQASGERRWRRRRARCSRPGSGSSTTSSGPSGRCGSAGSRAPSHTTGPGRA
ncbi:hypothetical protein U9M48_016183 [Paspalum notatum var. saurae]|uniref:Uncharacterized protein n=1 Tax=Paspalum notatum var. saurae TaxID=547442 RepID=A0AAQ3T847_PASNO